jgi:tRNA U34 2-thiouridine synthase MnmA/TrmU
VCAYESARWEVGDVDGRVTLAVEEMSFDKPVLLSPTLRLLDLKHAAHHEPDADGSYVAAQTHLALHRATDADPVRTWVLNAVTYALLKELAVPGRTVSDAVRNVAQAQKRVVDERFIDGLCTVLADFIEQRLILGAA